MESIFLNVEAVNTHRDKPQVGQICSWTSAKEESNGTFLICVPKVARSGKRLNA